MSQIKKLPITDNVQPIELDQDYEIFENLQQAEGRHLPNPDYMKNQTDINEKMRAILVDWLVEVHSKLKLKPETLFLGINILDRYLEKQIVRKDQLQLIGVVSILLACKYEEVYTPEFACFEHITDFACTRKSILEMEGLMLKALQFSFTISSPFMLMTRLFEKLKTTNQILFSLAKYLLELQLVEYQMLQYLPSTLAAGSIYLSLKMLRAIYSKQGLPDWTPEMCGFSKHSEKEIRDCAKDLCVLFQSSHQSSLQAIRKKYSSAEHLQVALLKVPEPNTKRPKCINTDVKGYKEAR